MRKTTWYSNVSFQFNSHVHPSVSCTENINSLLAVPHCSLIFLNRTERVFIYNVVVRESNEKESKGVELVKKSPADSQPYSAPSFHLADDNGGTGSALQPTTTEKATSDSQSYTAPSLHVADGSSGIQNVVEATPEQILYEDETSSCNQVPDSEKSSEVSQDCVEISRES